MTRRGVRSVALLAALASSHSAVGRAQPAPETTQAPEGGSAEGLVPDVAPAPADAPPTSAAEATRRRLDTPPELDGKRPSPLEVDYAQYGVAIAATLAVDPGGTCPPSSVVPCILGSGGGPVLRGGYRPSGPWYVGGAYQFSKLDSSNLYRLGILQELRGELRYFFDMRARVSPYVTWGGGGHLYGNEFGAETAGASAFLGGGIEFEVSRAAVIGANLSYQPMLFAGFTDAAGLERDTGVAQFVRLELVVELRTELRRE